MHWFVWISFLEHYTQRHFSDRWQVPELSPPGSMYMLHISCYLQASLRRKNRVSIRGTLHDSFSLDQRYQASD